MFAVPGCVCRCGCAGCYCHQIQASTVLSPQSPLLPGHCTLTLARPSQAPATVLRQTLLWIVDSRYYQWIESVSLPCSKSAIKVLNAK